MRLRMRTLVSLAVAVAPLLTSVSGCFMRKPPNLKTDTFSGKPKGSALVKILVTLSDDAEKKCVAKVDPDYVIVFRGLAWSG